MLWIFKTARWTHNRCTKINKSPTVSSGVGASSFEIWTANLAQWLTIGTLTNSRSFIFWDSNWKFCKVPQNLTFRCGYFWLGIYLFFMHLFFAWKKSKPVGYTRTLYSQTGENMKWAETFVWCLLLIFKVVYQDHLTVTSLCVGLCSKRAAAGLGPRGLNEPAVLIYLSKTKFPLTLESQGRSFFQGVRFSVQTISRGRAP